MECPVWRDGREDTAEPAGGWECKGNVLITFPDAVTKCLTGLVLRSKGVNT